MRLRLKLFLAAEYTLFAIVFVYLYQTSGHAVNWNKHYDGNGFPEGINGDDIPLGARVLAVCDAFDVMANGTICQVPMDKEKVIKKFKDCTGTQFDPQISYAIIKLLENGTFDDIFANNLANYKQKYNIATTVN